MKNSSGFFLTLTLGISLSFLGWGSTLSFAESVATPIADSLVKPTSEWTGTLTLPDPSARRPDGGVWIQIKNSPVASLKGKTLWLSYGDASSSVSAREFYRQFLDVNFTQSAFDQMVQNKVILATRVNGWKKVSPLESLAAALPTGQIHVTLETPSYDGNQVIVHSEPILIAGHEMIFVRFNKTLAGNQYEVSHYDSTTKTFSGPKSVIRLTGPSFLQDDHTIGPVAWSGIESFPQNPQGWMIFGNRESDGTFDALAAEPTSLFSTTAGFSEIQDQQKMLDFFNGTHWAIRNRNLQGTERKTAIEFGASLPQLFTLGTKFLLIHVFGGSQAVSPMKIGPISFYSGHFAYGTAQVVPHPFTGEPKIDVVYNQIFASNANFVVAGRNAYHLYANDTSREIGVVRPFSDVLVPLPELFHTYQLGNQSLDVEALLQTQFSLMQGWYRIGAGTGVAIVEPYSSCVQDSTQVMLNSIWNLKQMTEQDPIKSWIKANPKNSEVILFKSLLDFAQRANDKLGGNSNPIDLIMGLQNHSYLPAIFRDPANVNPLEFLGLTLRTLSTAVPRATQDRLIEEVLERRRSMILLDTFDTLGHSPAYAPIEAQIPIGVSTVMPDNFPDNLSDSN